MGKKDKKKGKGAEKTAAKTEKKALQKVKKELAAKGEDDLEKLIAEFQEKDLKQSYIGEERCAQPSPRSGFSLCVHPEKDELILFGGEYFNGSKTEMYNELYFYNIRKDQWSIVQCPNKPPPRCSHQAVIVPQAGGQMFVFGGEFASPTRSQFYHYKDLWLYHFADRRWEQVKMPGCPSSRSGHRMILSRKQLIIFGGFHESVRDYKYFSDVYSFDLEKYQWTKIEASGNGPCPRSGCQMAPLVDGRILIYGGYSKTKVKKDVDKGTAHSDMYYLQFDERSANAPKWKWITARQTGIQPLPRSGFSMTVAPNNRAYFFGGVHDEEDSEEMLTGVLHDDLYLLELDKGRWHLLSLRGNIKDEKRRRRNKKDGTEETECDLSDTDSTADDLHKLTVTDPSNEEQMEVKTYEDSVFTVKISSVPSVQSQADASTSSVSADESSTVKPFCPHPRMNASMAVKHGMLYLYGGLHENDDKQLTLSDFYSLDLHKLDEWKTIIASNIESLEWCESELSSSESDDDKDGDEESVDEAADTKEENDNSDMDTS